MNKLLSIISILLLTASGAFAQYGYNVSQWSGGGWSWSHWGSSSLQRDYCPNGDNTFSYYDGMCGDESDNNVDDSTTVETTTVTTTNSVEPLYIITVEEEVMINEIKEELEAIHSPTVETIVLPSFLPATWASL